MMKGFKDVTYNCTKKAKREFKSVFIIVFSSRHIYENY